MKVTIEISDEEFNAWQRASGRLGLLEWIRVRCNEQAAAARLRALVVSLPEKR